MSQLRLLDMHVRVKLEIRYSFFNKLLPVTTFIFRD